MKQKKLLIALAILFTTLGLQSCLNDDDNDNSSKYPNALVTLKTDPANGSFYLQLDDSTKIIPSNLKSSPYGKKEVRALINYKKENTPNKKPTAPAKQEKTITAHINWIDSILTKKMAADMGAKNDATYGKDPLEIVKDWTTSVEDGYLTIRFRTYYGKGVTHTINLVQTSTPYELELHHNANGDVRAFARDGLVAFKLDKLAPTQGKTVEITLKWNSFSGPKSTKFKFKK